MPLDCGSASSVRHHSRARPCIDLAGGTAKCQKSFKTHSTRSSRAAADKAALFLKVIQERAERERVGLSFSVRQIRKTSQFVLEAPVQFGGLFLKGLPMKVIVHADPIGSSLQVGWQLTQQELHAIASWSESARERTPAQACVTSSPRTSEP